MKSNKVIHHTGRDANVFSTVEDEIETLRTTTASHTSTLASHTTSIALATLALSGYMSGFINGSLAASVGSSALTVAVKTLAGTDPSSSDPVYLVFRNVTEATGTPTTLTLTSALSLTISSGSTMGTSASAPFRLWVGIFNDGGTARLAAINCYTSTSVAALADGISNSTAEGGAGAADSAGVIYTDTAATSKAFKVLGYLEWSSGLATPGTWSSGPTKIQLHGPGGKLPGDIVQLARVQKVDTFTGTSTAFADVTGLSVSMTPISATNLVLVTVVIMGTTDTPGNRVGFQVLRGSTSIGGGTRSGTNRKSMPVQFAPSTDGLTMQTSACRIWDAPASTSSQTYKVQYIVQSTGTAYVNRSASDTDLVYVGRGSSTIELQEVMA